MNVKMVLVLIVKLAITLKDRPHALLIQGKKDHSLICHSGQFLNQVVFAIPWTDELCVLILLMNPQH